MKKIIIFGSLFLVLSTLMSCKKEEPATVVTGIVTDSLSGAALANVQVAVKKNRFTLPITLGDAVTNSDGFYSISHETPDGKYQEYVEASEAGFTTRSSTIKPGISNTVNLKLAKIPSYLKVNFERTNLYDSVQVRLIQAGRFPLTKVLKCRNNSAACPDQLFQVTYGIGVKAEIIYFTPGIPNTPVESFHQPIANDTIDINVYF